MVVLHLPSLKNTGSMPNWATSSGVAPSTRLPVDFTTMPDAATNKQTNK